MKHILISSFIAIIAMTGCASTTSKIPPKQATAPKSNTPTASPTPKAIGSSNQCFIRHLSEFDGLLVFGGVNQKGQYYSCAKNSVLRITSGIPDFIADLVPYVCDVSKPVIQTSVREGMSIQTTCTYQDNGIPNYLQGVHIQVVRAAKS